MRHEKYTREGEGPLSYSAVVAEQEGRRSFSKTMIDSNRPFMQSTAVHKGLVKVAFILPEHFSLMAFTAALDTLVTANLIYTDPLFSFSVYGLEDATVRSDLGIDLSTNGKISRSAPISVESFDILIIVGGFRCSFIENSVLSSMLCAAKRRNKVLGGIWNGAVHLAYAGLLEGVSCALHPDNHSFMHESFTGVKLSRRSIELDSGFITCSGPTSALEMMLVLVEQFHGKEVQSAIKNILSSDQEDVTENQKLTAILDSPATPESLCKVIEVMTSRIEDPVTIDELANLYGFSRRQLERQFQNYLSCSPHKFYLEIRLTHARCLLLQTRKPVLDIALACGFVSGSHFTKCYKDFFGVSPTKARQDHWNM